MLTSLMTHMHRYLHLVRNRKEINKTKLQKNEPCNADLRMVLICETEHNIIHLNCTDFLHVFIDGKCCQIIESIIALRVSQIYLYYGKFRKTFFACICDIIALM